MLDRNRGKSGAGRPHAQVDSPLRSTPHKTRIVGNLESGAVITAQDMAAEAGTATLLDRRHYLQLAEADMACVVAAPRRPVVAKDIRHLQGRPCHRRRLDGRVDVQILKRAFHLVQKFGCDLAVAGGVLELFVAQEHLDDADILVVLEQVRGEGMPTMNAARRVYRFRRPRVPYEMPGSVAGSIRG